LTEKEYSEFYSIFKFCSFSDYYFNTYFWIGAYFLYKVREKQRRKGSDIISYEELRDESGRKFLFFDEVRKGLNNDN